MNIYDLYYRTKKMSKAGFSLTIPVGPDGKIDPKIAGIISQAFAEAKIPGLERVETTATLQMKDGTEVTVPADQAAKKVEEYQAEHSRLQEQNDRKLLQGIIKRGQQIQKEIQELDVPKDQFDPKFHPIRMEELMEEFQSLMANAEEIQERLPK